MCVDTAKPLEAPGSQSVLGQIRDQDVLVVTHDHIGHFPFAGHQKGHLSFNLMGNRGKLAG